MSQTRLPPHWRMVGLGEVSETTWGSTLPSDMYNTEGRGLPFLQGKSKFADFSPEPAKYCTTPFKVAKQGSILMCVRAPVGDVNLADQGYIIRRGLASFMHAYLPDWETRERLLREYGVEVLPVDH